MQAERTLQCAGTREVLLADSALGAKHLLSSADLAQSLTRRLGTCRRRRCDPPTTVFRVNIRGQGVQLLDADNKPIVSDLT
jgi:hypothetical protein